MGRTSGTVTTDSYVSFGPNGPFCVIITGTWTGTLTLRSTDDGSTWDTIKTYTSNPDPPAELVNAVSGKSTYQVYGTSVASGSASVVMKDV